SELAPPLKRPLPRSAARLPAPRPAVAGPERMPRVFQAWRGVAIALMVIAAAALGYAMLHLTRPTHPVPLARVEPAAMPVATPSPARPDPGVAAQAREGPPVAAPVREARSASPRAAPKRVVEAAPSPPPPPIDRFQAAVETPPPVPVPEPAPAPRPAPPP